MNRLHLPPPFTDPEHFPGNLTVVNEDELTRENAKTAAQGRTSNHTMDRDAEIVEEEDEAETMDLSSGPESELESDLDNGDDDNAMTGRVSTLIPVPTRPRKQRRRSPRSVDQRRRLGKPPKTASGVISKPTNAAVLSEMFDGKPISGQPSGPMLRLEVPHQLQCSADAPEKDTVEGGFGVMKRITRENVSGTTEQQAAGKVLLDDARTTAISNDFQLRKGSSNQ